MKVSIKTKRVLGSACLMLLSLVLGGCEHLYYADPNPEKPYVFPTEPQVATAKPWTPPTVATPSGSAPIGNGPALVPVSTSQNPAALSPTSVMPTVPHPGSPGDLSSSVLQKGDTVTIAFSDLPQPIPERKERIPDDGKLTLPFNVVVKADGKTAFQLEREIEKEYVPKYYVRLTVSVKPEDRYYFVGGEVKIQNRQQYIGRMTVLRAIDTAGGFTDFANRKKIEVRRASGQKSNVNWYEAVKDPSKDPEIFPNDQIIVHKKFW